MCVCVVSISQDSPRLPSQRLGITDFRGRHHWAGATRLLMTASNLCRGPVNGSQSVRVCIRECVCVCVCVCVCTSLTARRHRELLHHLAAGVCVSPLRWIQRGRAFTPLHFPLSISQLSMACKTPFAPVQNLIMCLHGHAQRHGNDAVMSSCCMHFLSTHTPTVTHTHMQTKKVHTR